VERFVNLGGGGATGSVSLHNPFLRYAANPILTASDVNDVWRSPALQVVTVHNAGVGSVDGETVVLFRSHLRSGLSVLGTAWSADGVTGWRVDPAPALLPATPGDRFAAGIDVDEAVEMEAGGVEDPRVHLIDGTFAVTYSAYHARERNRVRVALATSRDLRCFVRHGPLLDRDMRNVVLFPDRIDGRHVGLFRPNDVLPGDVGGAYTRIHVGSAADFRTGPWEIDPDPVMRTGHGPSAFSDKIGPGAPPLRTRHGWLNLFHGVRTTMDGNPYVLGVALHDLADPRRVRMSSIPVLFPTRADCRVAEDSYVHVPNVVFTCGATRGDDGTIVVYYAGNDTVLNIGASHEDVLAALCIRYGQDPLTGALHYPLQAATPD
jgi:predicted GH43/DUF377 family glycosyl hydrolase